MTRYKILLPVRKEFVDRRLADIVPYHCKQGGEKYNAKQWISSILARYKRKEQLVDILERRHHEKNSIV
jgi:hypothetical protein